MIREGNKMFINAKDHILRCPECGEVVGYEMDSFCHSCGEFFTNMGTRWFDTITEWNDQSLGSLDIKMEGDEDDIHTK